MTWVAVAIGGGAALGYMGAERTAGALEAGSASQLQAAREAQALNRERYGEAQGLLTPYIEEARIAREQMMIEMGLAPGEAGTAYMETPGYKSMLEERQAGVEQASSASGSLYSGRRAQAAADVGSATQSQFYTNYMNLLQNMGSPQVATNLASLGVNQGISMGGQQIGAQQAASQYQIGAAQTQQAAMGDILGMGANIYSGYLQGGGGYSGGGGGYYGGGGGEVGFV